MSNQTMTEIVFEVTQEADGGFCAEAVGHAIFTQADSWEELYDNAKEAVSAYFFDEPGDYMVRLQFTRNEVFAIA